ncbi:MAG: spore germination protein [Bacillota bacterium]|nr:MAG: spore germination protein [Bacillota bacterium]
MAVAWWERLAALLDPAATEPPAAFTLGDRGEQPPEELEETRRRLREVQETARALGTRVDRYLAALGQSGGSPGEKGAEAYQGIGDLSPSLAENLERLKQRFRAPDNADLIIREIQVATRPPVRAAVVFLEGMAEKGVINSHILEPLMLLAHLDHHLEGPGDPSPTADPGRASAPMTGEGAGKPSGGGPKAGQPPGGGNGAGGPPDSPLQAILERLLPGNQTEVKPALDSVIDSLLYGDTAIFVDGCTRAITVETKGFPVRSVSTPQQEMVTRGPLDAFTESFRMNIGLVRRRIRDPRLVTEILQVGTLGRTYVAVLYVDGVVNPKLVKEVKRRIASLRVDYVGSSGALEQLVEDRPLSLFPQTLSTERPDRVAAYLAEGHVAALMDNSPFALVLPATFWSQLQTSEDYDVRWPFGSVLRWLRFAALATAVLTGGLYIAAVNFHHDMIPTELMLFIAARREQVPLPAGLELLFMEIAFELIREAGVRIPSVIGPTIGIVGALIMGQALVSAQLASPVVIIITALSGLASFAIPNYSTSFGLRTLRFAFIALALALGIYGIAVGLFAVGLHLAGLRSFGVPYLSPLAPRVRHAPDVAQRGPLYDMEFRPRSIRPVDSRRQAPVARPWDPKVPRWLRRRQPEGGSGEPR